MSAIKISTGAGMAILALSFVAIAGYMGGDRISLVRPEVAIDQ